MSGNIGLHFAGIASMLDREYRNAPAYQWGRELVRNGIEADAHNIQIGVEWRAVEARRIYRLQYADDGIGMSRDDLREYMRTLGKGSKLVGGPHDNYALGCRMTLLPWNPAGVVVISVVDGETNMVKMMYDSDQEEYVLANELVEAGEETINSTVYPPYLDEDEGINWMETVPSFINEAGHGTTFVLLGRDPNQDTINGDPERGESIRVMTRKYFNTRFWSMPEGVTLRFVEFTAPTERSNWPKSVDERDAYQYRTARGAEAVVQYVKRDGSETLQSSGTETLPDGTKAHWWLRRDPKVDTGGIGGSSSGFIAVRYCDELYGQAYANRDDGDSRSGAAIYRQFGIGNDEVRKRVFVVLEPPKYDDETGRPGVAPSTGRADLYWLGRGLSARSVKPSDWAEAFADQMPDPIQQALRAAYEAGQPTGEEREERLKRIMDRFSKRWKAIKARTEPDLVEGDTTTDPAMQGTDPRQPIDSPTPVRGPHKARRRVVVRGRAGDVTIGADGAGTEPAKRTRVTLGYPGTQWVKAEDIQDPGMIAAWQGPSATWPNGLIQLDEGHPVVQGQIKFWQSQYPAAHAAQVEATVKAAYEDVAIAKVSHMHSLAGTPTLSEERLHQMLLNPALTASLLGLISEDAVISPRLGGLGAKRRKESRDADSNGAAGPTPVEPTHAV